MSKGAYDAALRMPCCGVEVVVGVTWEYDPGVHTFRNGDPGYPPSSEFIVDLPSEFDEIYCPNCQHTFSDAELEELDRAAEAQQPVEQDEPDLDEFYYDDGERDRDESSPDLE